MKNFFRKYMGCSDSGILSPFEDERLGVVRERLTEKLEKVRGMGAQIPTMSVMDFYEHEKNGERVNIPFIFLRNGHDASIEFLRMFYGVCKHKKIIPTVVFNSQNTGFFSENLRITRPNVHLRNYVESFDLDQLTYYQPESKSIMITKMSEKRTTLIGNSHYGLEMQSVFKPTANRGGFCVSVQTRLDGLRYVSFTHTGMQVNLF